MGWTLIEHQSLSNSAASVTLGSGGTIPQTYKTLKLLVSLREDGTAGVFFVNLNGSTSNQTQVLIYTSGTSVLSATASNINSVLAPSSFTASTFSNAEITIPNYSGNTNKPVAIDAVAENNAASSGMRLTAALWSNTAAVTSITLTANPGVSNFVSGSSFSLYGLK